MEENKYQEVAPEQPVQEKTNEVPATEPTVEAPKCEKAKSAKVTMNVSCKMENSYSRDGR